MEWQLCAGCDNVIRFFDPRLLRDHIDGCENTNNASDNLLLRFVQMKDVRNSMGGRDLIRKYKNGKCFTRISRL